MAFRLLLLFVTMLPAVLGASIDAQAVWVVANSNEDASVDLARYYIKQREIPEDHLISLPLSSKEAISWDEYLDTIYHPILEAGFDRGFLEGSLSDRKDGVGRREMLLLGNHLEALVLCKGVPLKIHNDPARVDPKVVVSFAKTVRSSVDAELAATPLGAYAITGPLTNPCFRGRQSRGMVDAPWVVSRLDGPSYELARGLVDLAMRAEKHGTSGRAYVDIQGPHAAGDQWFRATRDAMRKDAWDVSEHDKPGRFQVLDRFDRPLFYFGWYSSVLDGVFTRKDFEFPVGAVALHLHSSSAATLRSFEKMWTGPLVARGVTITFGNVSEPYLHLTVYPQYIYEGFAKGMCAGEVMLYAHPALSWQTIMLGDPLYQPHMEILANSQDPYQQVRAYLKEPDADSWRALVKVANEGLSPVLPIFLMERAGTEAWEQLPRSFYGKVPVPSLPMTDEWGAWNRVAELVWDQGELGVAWAIWDSVYLGAEEDAEFCHQLMKFVKTKVGAEVFAQRYGWHEREAEVKAELEKQALGQ